MADVMTPEQRSRCMAAIKGMDTKPEMIVRRYLFSRRLCYRVNDRKLSGPPDIVLEKYKTVVFIDGCFRHGHKGSKYFRLPKTNVDFWWHKIAKSIACDYANGVDLCLAGWKVIRVLVCYIKTKAKREETLERLYQEIIGTEHNSNAYAFSIKANPIAAEPNSSYGDKYLSRLNLNIAHTCNYLCQRLPKSQKKFVTLQYNTRLCRQIDHIDRMSFCLGKESMCAITYNQYLRTSV